jgi:hypothetical protein
MQIKVLLSHRARQTFVKPGHLGAKDPHQVADLVLCLTPTTVIASNRYQ